MRGSRSVSPRDPSLNNEAPGPREARSTESVQIAETGSAREAPGPLLCLRPHLYPGPGTLFLVPVPELFSEGNFA